MHKIINWNWEVHTNDGGSEWPELWGQNSGRERRRIPSGGGFLKKLNQIDMRNFDKRLQEVGVFIASDVTNPLTGNNGASYVFGPQKELQLKWLKNWTKT
ncbi:Glycerate 2-kinase [Lactococcus lactis]|nr:Glycerate 2-kinase [Lactococcus lactis]